jgi:hypothetical protein
VEQDHSRVNCAHSGVPGTFDACRSGHSDLLMVSGGAKGRFELRRRLKLQSATASDIWQTWKREAYGVRRK